VNAIGDRACWRPRFAVQPTPVPSTRGRRNFRGCGTTAVGWRTERIGPRHPRDSQPAPMPLGLVRSVPILARAPAADGQFRIPRRSFARRAASSQPRRRAANLRVASRSGRGRQASPASRTNPGQSHEFPPASSLRRSSRLEFLAGTPAPWRPSHRKSGVVPTVLAGQVALPHMPRATSSAVQASWPQAMAPLKIHAVEDPRSPPRRHASARRRGFVRPNVRKQTL
jgi:hypothetical protein